MPSIVRRMSSRIWELMTFFATIVAVIGSITAFFYGDPTTRLTQSSSDLRAKLTDTTTRIDILSNQLNLLREDISAIKKKPPTDIEIKTKLDEVDKIRAELDELKNIVVENPAKALALPLMQKDVSDLRKRQDELATSTDIQIGRIYDFSKWFLALMITLSIGLVTMGFVRMGKSSS